MAPHGPALTAEVCTDQGEFGGLAAAWARLHRRCRTATPFQSHAWLHSWWLSYGRRGRLRVVLVRRDGELVAAAPLMRTYLPLPALVPLGGAISDFTDVLLDDACADEALEALADGLSRLARGALIDFREVRSGAAVERIYERWRGPRLRLTDSLCLELPAASMGELLGRLPARRAQRVRANIRKIDALGVERRIVRHDEVDASVRTLLHLHQLQWQGRKVTSEHLQPRFSEHLIRSVGLMVRAGDAVVTEFRLDDAVVAADLTLLSPGLVGGYLYGAHPRLRERKVDVATMLLNANTEHAEGDRARVLSLLRGNEPYKHHWRPEAVTNHRFLLASRRTAPVLRAAACDAAARSRCKEYLRRREERGGGS
ncbi:GNAT family N-acetyltransferase [Streptomyces sp. NBC_01381]|uniref:GNAT family N-acetyltransferase n=1 Tax=Streptomyces sp. NBC_01381 TaxID=2903845 RepID=UPI00225B1CAD|nr:GNAT family N-acetyltransferase [Streptomyces sp. NBC_01381]MCX4669664.1 GNAT family N-acetyltransferase [Streptomyces sp. NBC_01381]